MNSGDKFGIEIETVGLGKAEIASAIHSVVGGVVSVGYDRATVTMADGRVWSVVRDGSLNPSLPNGEIVSPILLASEIEELQKIVRAVRAAGARVDSTCGIHVHVDGARFDARSLTNLVVLVNRREKMIHAAIGVAPHRASSYCKMVDQDFVARLEASKPTTLAGFSKAWYGYECSADRYHSSRYHGLNLNSFFYRGTVEFRYFNGTLHAGEVKAYVQFVLSLTSAAVAKKTASKVRRVKPGVAPSERQMFQAFMANIGMKGEAFKTARLHLTKRFAGGHRARSEAA